MNIIEQTLIQKSQAIFDKLDKWNALFELQGLNNQIIEHWLNIGTKGLRNYFLQNPSNGWRWERWGDDIDTRWYLEEFKSGSLAIGFGWHYQFHLHLNDKNRFDSNLIDTQLKKEKYAKLLIPFGVNPTFYNGGVRDTYFNFFFESLNDGNIPIHELAWYAAHRTGDFVKQAAGKIERFTRDSEMTRLLTELNAEAQKPSTS